MRLRGLERVSVVIWVDLLFLFHCPEQLKPNVPVPDTFGVEPRRTRRRACRSGCTATAAVTVGRQLLEEENIKKSVSISQNDLEVASLVLHALTFDQN